MTMTILEAIHQLCAGLPRHSPGSESTTLKALRRLGRLSRRTRVIDMGCGTGVSTRVLARRFDGPIVAVDAHRPFLDELTSALCEEGFRERVETLHADFTTLEAAGQFELLWSEASAYVLGFERALTTWWALLAPGAHVAVTELCYLIDQPSDEVKEFVGAINPTVTTVVGNTAAAERAGYNIVDTLLLSNRDYRAYYNPIKARIAALRAAGDVSAELAVVVAEFESEMALHERHDDEFGWVFFLLEKPGNGVFEAKESPSDDEDDSCELEADNLLPSIRGNGSSKTRGFDSKVAQANPVTYQKLEQRLVELIRECGLKEAGRVLAEVEASVGKVIRR